MRLSTLRRLPRGVWALGFVSLFMDVSSELVHSLLPVFLVTTLGASMLTLGLIEGVAEAAASVTRVFSGYASDRLGRRKGLTVLGYGLAALTKPFFPLADGAATVFAARFVDRIGKGIRGAPRDALIGDITPPALRGAGYGLRQSLDTAGAVAGPLAAIGLMAALANDIRAVFWFAVIPAVVALVILVVAVREPEASSPGKAGARIRLAELGGLGRFYWAVVGAGGVLTLARFSEAFLVLRAESVGLSHTYIPVVMVVMSATYTLSAYPAGALSDQIGRRRLLAAGFAVLIAADLVLARADRPSLVLLGVGLWGLHMGLSQGLLAALVADASPARLRGTAFGLFNLVSGALLLGASVLAGALWQAAGPSATFHAGAAITGVGLAALLAAPRLARRRSNTA
jgi:MFS family permease